MKDKKYIIGNWKMNPETVKDARAIFLNIKEKASKLSYTQTIICSSYVHLPELVRNVTGHRCKVGAQNVSSEKKGARTGEISVGQLVDMKVSHVIVGHSEIRATGDSDELVARKIKLLLKHNIIPVLCIGEKARDEVGSYTVLIKKQLLASLDGVSKKNIMNIIFAYEPIWAIGKEATKEATPEDVLETVILIRKIITDAFGKKVAENLTIIYGGSVNPENTEGFLVRSGVQGLLVGRESLNPESFNSILKIANKL